MIATLRIFRPVIGVLALMASTARADLFPVVEPRFSVTSGQALVCIGPLLMLAMLGALFARMRRQKRFSFSLRWLLGFSLACSTVIWGAVRWHQAEQQLREREKAQSLNKHLRERLVSLEMADCPVKDAVQFMNSICKTEAQLDPTLDLTQLSPAFACPYHDITAEHGFKHIAKSAGLQCELKHGQFLLCARSKEVLESDAELARKLSASISVDFTNSPLKDVLQAISAASHLGVVVNPTYSARFPGREAHRVNLHLKEVRVWNAIYWIERLLETRLDVNDCCLENRLSGTEGYDVEEKDRIAIQKRLEDCKVSFELNDKPLAEALEFIAKAANVTIVVDPKVMQSGPQPINLRVTDMPAGLALKWIFKLSELDYDIRCQVIFASVKADI